MGVHVGERTTPVKTCPVPILARRAIGPRSGPPPKFGVGAHRAIGAAAALTAGQPIAATTSTATTARIPSGRGYRRRARLRKRSGYDDRDCSARGIVPAEVVEQYVEAWIEIDRGRPLLAGCDHDRGRRSLADRAPVADRALLPPPLG